MFDEKEYLVYMLLEQLKPVGRYLLIALAVVYFSWAISLGTIAKRRQLKKRWLAWIPLANLWLLGSIADQYDYVVLGKVSNSRKDLLRTTLALLISTGFILAILWMQARWILEAVEAGKPPDALLWIPAKKLQGNLFCFGLYFCLCAMYLAERTDALYKVYRSCDPDRATVSTILSVLPVMGIFFRPMRLMACRWDDYGMPPRREEYTDMDIPVFYGSPETEPVECKR